MVICLKRGADLHMAQLMPLPLTVSCFSKIQIGFTFLVPAHPGSPGKRAIKRVCVVMQWLGHWICNSMDVSLTFSHHAVFTNLRQVVHTHVLCYQAVKTAVGKSEGMNRHTAIDQPRICRLAAWASAQLRAQRHRSLLTYGLMWLWKDFTFLQFYNNLH